MSKEIEHLGEKFAQYLMRVNSVEDGIQLIYQFDNGYGASIIRHSKSYGGNIGLSELAVLRFADIIDMNSAQMCCFTPITYDVEGYLEISDVNTLLNSIMQLNPKEEKKWIKKYNKIVYNYIHIAIDKKTNKIIEKYNWGD